MFNACSSYRRRVERGTTTDLKSSHQRRTDTDRYRHDQQGQPECFTCGSARELPFLFVGGVPCRIFMKRCHRICDRGSVRAKILFRDNIVIGDDEGHHTG
jgi:hypothetical protein